MVAKETDTAATETQVPDFNSDQNGKVSISVIVAPKFKEKEEEHKKK